MKTPLIKGGQGRTSKSLEESLIIEMISIFGIATMLAYAVISGLQ